MKNVVVLLLTRLPKTLFSHLNLKQFAPEAANGVRGGGKVVRVESSYLLGPVDVCLNCF